jgi:hypothetical protein
MQQIALQEVVRQRRRRRRLQPRAAAAPKRGKGPGVAVEGGGDTGEKTKLSPNWPLSKSLREEVSAVYNCKEDPLMTSVKLIAEDVTSPPETLIPPKSILAKTGQPPVGTYEADVIVAVRP